MSTPETLNLIGRICVAFYFLWATQFNLRAWQHHIAELERIGVPFATPVLAIGLAMQALGSVLLLAGPTLLWGGCILIVFTATADALFHRFWTYPDPAEQVMHKFFLCEHVALIGGLLGLMAAHL